MRSYTFARSSCCALAAAVALTATPARAQTPPLALDRFDPAPAGDRMFGVPSPYVAGDKTPHGMVLLDYAHKPLVLHTLRDNNTVGSVVSNQMFLHLDATLALLNRLAVNVDLPVALVQTGDNPAGAGQSFPSPTSAQIGDLRLGLRLRIWGNYFDAIQVAIGGSVWVPTGASNSFVSDGKVRGLPQLILGGRTDRIVWSFATGPEIRASQNFGGVNQGSMFRFGAGVGVLLGEARRFQLGVETYSSIVLQDINKRTTNGEILLDGRYRFLSFLEAGIGIGPGLSSGIGTPDFRGVAMIAYTPEQKPALADRDKDGIPDIYDACPDVFGIKSDDPKKNGCPPPSDRDHDGILDVDDACPDVPGIKSDDPKKNGCPPPSDRDHDGILDVDDACPDVFGVKSDDPTKNGCPVADRDGDGIPDSEDACPDVKGVRDPDPKFNGCPPDIDADGIPNATDHCPYEKGAPDPDPNQNGCPKSVRVVAGEIIILQQVQFDTGKTTIKKASDALLEEVAQVMRDHAEITKIQVEGHTDTVGTPASNQVLSQGRAEAVVQALVARKIDPSRLVAKGFGQTVPIGDNKTPDGRAKNRRVQFKITEKRAGGTNVEIR